VKRRENMRAIRVSFEMPMIRSSEM